MSTRVLHSVLAFPIGIISGLMDNPGPGFDNMFMVSVYIGHSYHNGNGWVGVPSLSCHQGTFPELQLGAMVLDSQALGKSKGLTQPIDSFPHIGIRQFRDDHTRRHGTVHINLLLKKRFSEGINREARCIKINLLRRSGDFVAMLQLYPNLPIHHDAKHGDRLPSICNVII
jgi:hypothetical protein